MTLRPRDEEAVSFFIEGEPVPFARAHSNGAQRFTPARQRAYREAVQWKARDAFRMSGPLNGPVRLTVCATFKIPQSYSTKRAIAANWKASRPDLDNCIKEIADALNTIAYRDDAQICEVVGQKIFGLPVGSTITVEALA